MGVLCGIVAFLCVEKFVRIFSGGHSHGHSHSQPSPPSPKPDNDDKKDKKDKKSKKKDSDDDGDDGENDDSNNDKSGNEDTQDEIKVSGYLNLAADAFHNFTDGLAIGASFLAGNSIGYTTTFMILFHEIPHEVGDFAILIQSGVPRGRAIALQLVTALAAMGGCIVALVAQEAGQAAASGFILPFTAGGFIYIATVSVIPELLEGTSLKQSFCEIVALLVGVFMMVLIANFEN